MIGMIVFAGVFVGMVKGQQIRHKWVAKMKNRQQEKDGYQSGMAEILLDEIEMSTYHS